MSVRVWRVALSLGHMSVVAHEPASRGGSKPRMAMGTSPAMQKATLLCTEQEGTTAEEDAHASEASNQRLQTSFARSLGNTSSIRMIAHPRCLRCRCGRPAFLAAIITLYTSTRPPNECVPLVVPFLWATPSLVKPTLDMRRSPALVTQRAAWQG